MCPAVKHIFYSTEVSGCGEGCCSSDDDDRNTDPIHICEPTVEERIYYNTILKRNNKSDMHNILDSMIVTDYQRYYFT